MLKGKGENILGRGDCHDAYACTVTLLYNNCIGHRQTCPSIALALLKDITVVRMQ